MAYKFESLEVWQLALAYINQIYALAERLPRSEEYNLKSQITRAATSIALNVAEGSAGALVVWGRRGEASPQHVIVPQVLALRRKTLRHACALGCLARTMPWPAST